MMTVKDLKKALEYFNDDAEVMIWDYHDTLREAHLECRENIVALAEDYEYSYEAQCAMADAFFQVMDK